MSTQESSDGNIKSIPVTESRARRAEKTNKQKQLRVLGSTIWEIRTDKLSEATSKLKFLAVVR